MPQRSLAEWLRWQESLYPRWMELALDRVQEVAGRLGVPRPAGPVFTVAGTNGKGSTVTLLEAFLLRAGLRPGVYTSPHLISYNERIRVADRAAADEELIDAFERIEAARGSTPLTFFEFGTLAALSVFHERRCDAWVLEIGMGGRLDAVNIIDPDFAVITTVSLDHQEYLGHSVEAIAAEKAGILRTGRPGFYGDWPVPESVRRVAAERDARLFCLGEHFDFTPARPAWSWRGERVQLSGLQYPPAATAAQLRNASVTLAALEQYKAALIENVESVNEVITTARPAGRFQVVNREHEWILDVAHNPQAVETLRLQLGQLRRAPDVTLVIGILGDKSLDAFATELGPMVNRWIACTVNDARARSAGSIAGRLRELGVREVQETGTPEMAFDLAREVTAAGGRIIVCGSFRVVGPALQSLGIY